MESAPQLVGDAPPPLTSRGGIRLDEHGANGGRGSGVSQERRMRSTVVGATPAYYTRRAKLDSSVQTPRTEVPYCG